MKICKDCVVAKFVLKRGEDLNSFFCPWKSRIIGRRGKSCSKFKDAKEGYNGALVRMFRRR